ncbi:MAG: tetratricopeptide repeat protein [Sphingomonadales bacterium]|nr:tetratricopeptide repeat protein [Sphingomonadales bacterium]
MYRVVGRSQVLASLVLALSVFLSACSSGPGDLERLTAAEPSIFGALPSERALSKGKRSYRNGDYGLAEQSFRLAIEEDRNNVEAWLGLAASYDRLRRFDQADRAYNVLFKMVGQTPTVLNNRGYHYILRGDYALARQTLAAAQAADPGNPFVRNNLALLDKESTAKPAKL